MSSQRLKRLKNDHERLVKELEGNDFIKIVETTGDPPNQYTIGYHIRGVAFDPSAEQVSYPAYHEVKIILLTEYPTSPPYCKANTEIFHPNMSTSDVRIGGESAWSASKSLLDVVKQLACMISYQDYDLNSPLNKKAAKWAKTNEADLPLDSTDFFAQSPPEPDLQPDVDASEKTFCSYCLDPDPKNRCSNDHPTCEDCFSTCRHCDNITCLACTDNACGKCRDKVEAACSQIAATIEQGDIDHAETIAKNSSEMFPGAPRLTESLDKVQKIRRIIDHIEGFGKSNCFHGIVTECEELRSLGFENNALAELENKASDKLKAADNAVAQGEHELQANHGLELACQHFSDAMKVVPDHPSAFKLFKKTKARIDKARGHIESARGELDKGHYGRAIEHAKRAVSLDATLDSAAEEIVKTAGHLESLQRRKEKKRVLALLAAGAILILSVVIFFYVWEDGRLEAEYRLFLEEVENEVTVEAKIDALSVFVISHKRNRFTRDAEERIKELFNVVQERQFEIAKRNASVMLKNKDYEKAEKIYKEYLSQNPDTTYTPELNDNIEKLNTLMDDRDYETLTWLTSCNPRTRVGAYKTYLTNHPEGKYYEEVKKSLLDTSEAYYEFVKKETTRLKDNQGWDKCISMCDEFVENLDGSTWTKEIEAIGGECRKRRDDEKDLVSLVAEANTQGEDYEAAKQVYLRYLEGNPDSSVKMRIKNRVDRLDETLLHENEWKKMLAYVESGKNNIGDRIRRIETYMAQNASGENLEEAKELLKELEEERDVTAWKEIIRSCRNSQISLASKIDLLEGFVQRNVSGRYLGDAEAKLSELKREQAWNSWKTVARYCDDPRTDLSDRVNKLRVYIGQNPPGEFARDAQIVLHKLRRFQREEERIRRRIAETGSTYVYSNGIIKDTRTGLMWCAFDSYLELQQCLKYQSVPAYMRRINYGGYTDWRLPSETALRSIYKNKPFMPTASEGEWYWTSNQGSGYMVSVVTTERETEWQMAKIESDIGCGSIRAVRGP